MTQKKTSLAMFVHGIGASADDWWGTTRQAFMSDIALQHIAFKFFQYDTTKLPERAWWRPRWTYGKQLADLEQVGRDLWSELRLRYDESHFICVALFGHSMGGLVAAAAIVHGWRDNAEPDERELRSRIKVIGLCATPLGGADLAKFVRRMTSLYGPNQQLEDLCKDSQRRKRIVAKLENRVRTDNNKGADGAALTLLEFFEVAQDPIVSTDEECYGPWAKSESATLSLNGGHSECVRDLSASHPNYQRIVFWLKKHLPPIRPSPGEASEQPLNYTTAEFERLLAELDKELRPGGIFRTWKPPDDPQRDADSVYVLRVFLQKLLHAATKIGPHATGSANVWVCHQVATENQNRPSFLRSEEREGYFLISQLAIAIGPSVQYRSFPVSFEPHNVQEHSVAAQAVAEQRPVFQFLKDARFDSQAEQGLDITHILGVPLLYKPRNLPKLEGRIEGAPMSITIDFSFPGNVDERVKGELVANAAKIIALVDKFTDHWEGPLTVKGT